MKPASQNHFSMVPQVGIQRSAFKRNNAHKTTFNHGELIPIYCDEVLPGDTFSVTPNIFMRLSSALKYPIMDNIKADVHFFYVPARLCWEHHSNFLGENEFPDEEDWVDYLEPVLQAPAGGFVAGSLADYFGIPTDVSGLEVTAGPFRAYNLIYNEWYRDQNLQEKAPVNRGDGPDAMTDYDIRKRNKKHDYFTSCLPWPQKGEEVQIPIGGFAPVVGNGKAIGFQDEHATTNYGYGMVAYGTNSFYGSSEAFNQTLPFVDIDNDDTPHNGNAWGLSRDPDHSGVVADLSLATAQTINELRRAFQWQKFLERDARGGTRLPELIKSHFNVQIPDLRVMRPEFLGGTSFDVNVQPVTQQVDNAESPLGRQGAYGTAYNTRGGFSKSFVEHGYIIAIISTRADKTYQYGLNKMWSRRTRFDHYWPEFSSLGEQPVLRSEIYAVGTSQDDEVFGYQERYAEYRYKPSIISGQFRSNYAETLHAWHLAEEYGTPPVLGNSFIQENADLDRVLAITDTHHYIMDSLFEVRAVRPMPMYSVPGMIDHF